ncbi:MAG: hypothetical protein NZ482_03695 [Gloeomargarita sp. SKYG98]|nr:hypothetical protein [Gloeomargarita sp. SKYG98]
MNIVHSLQAGGQVRHGITYWTCQGAPLVNRQPKPVQGLFYITCSRVETLEHLYILASFYQDVNQLIYCDPAVLSLLEETESETLALTEDPEWRYLLVDGEQTLAGQLRAALQPIELPENWQKAIRAAVSGDAIDSVVPTL